MGTRISKEDSATIVKIFQEGKSIVDISDVLGTNIPTVKRILKKAGLFTPRKYNRKEVK